MKKNNVLDPIAAVDCNVFVIWRKSKTEKYYAKSITIKRSRKQMVKDCKKKYAR